MSDLSSVRKFRDALELIAAPADTKDFGWWTERARDALKGVSVETPAHQVNWQLIDMALGNAAKALPVLFTMCSKAGLRDGAETADQINADVKAAIKELAHFRESTAVKSSEKLGHDEAQAQIAAHVREIEKLCDAFGYDPTEWLAEQSTADTVCSCGKRMGEHPAQPPWWPCMLAKKTTPSPVVNCGYIPTACGYIIREGSQQGEWIATFKTIDLADEYVRLRGGEKSSVHTCEWSQIEEGSSTYNTCKPGHEFHLSDGLELWPFCHWCGGEIVVSAENGEGSTNE